jgi:hypothetical protein
MKPITNYHPPTKTVECNFCKTPIVRKRSYVIKRQEIGKSFYCDQICQSYEEISQKHAKMMDYVNDPNFYYLIGLMATDGHIDYPDSPTKLKVYYGIIKLDHKDEELLKSLCDYFGGKLYYENNGRTVCYRIFNPNFIKYLINVVGFTNNKTYNLNIESWFSTLSDEFKKAFILGCFDGDGSLRISPNRKYSLLSCYVCSASLQFLKTIQNYTHKTYNISGSLREVTKEEHNTYKSVIDYPKNLISTTSLYYYNLNGHQAKIICDLYKLANHITMKRKYDTALQILEYLKTKKEFKDRHSSYKGVCQNLKCEKIWSTKIIYDGTIIRGSRFSKEIYAAMVYDIMCMIFKKGLFLNFLNNLEFYKKIIVKYSIGKPYHFKNLTEQLIESEYQDRGDFLLSQQFDISSPQDLVGA